MKAKSRIPIILIALLCLALLVECRTVAYDVVSIRTRPWPDIQSQELRDAGIGYFVHTGDGRKSYSRRNLYDSMSFALRELGFIIIEDHQLMETLRKNDLPDDRLLSEDEIARVTREFGGRLFLQGRLEEVRTDTLTEDYTNVMVNVLVYDARRGEKIGEIKVFAENLSFHTGRQTLRIARLVARDLDHLIENRDKEAAAE